MSKTRDNHYVPQWYQEGFFDEGQKQYRYLDLKPEPIVLPDGRKFLGKHKFKSYTSQCFYTTDLYTTFFGRDINDEVERKLFGPIDDWGSGAVRAFIGEDVREWSRHFQKFFEYMDAQRYRTPKGLGWLRQHYPALSQNELMREMQGIQGMNCTLWIEGVREIVSAEDADIKFIVSDHPVSVYNYAVPPDHQLCRDCNDPAISLNATQTIFPLNKNFCLLLTNLEYAKYAAGVPPLEKRTFARNYRSSMVRTDAFIRSRRLSNLEVSRINFIIKSRAKRYIAGGKEEWLYPEQMVSDSWSGLRQTLMPPEDGLWHFGGEMYTKYESGEVRYQDSFGRTEKPREFLQKTVKEDVLSRNDYCGCGSGRKYKKCCFNKNVELRPSWSEMSIRERNIAHYRAIVTILGLDKGKDWVSVRRDLTDDQVSRIYETYEALWPLETDIVGLLPKPDGTARALYTGIIEPKLLTEFLVGSCLYADEILIENPFLHPGSVKSGFNPVKHPGKFHQDFLKSAFLLICLMPLIQMGVINLIPDPAIFDHHLRDQMMFLAEERHARPDTGVDPDARIKWLFSENLKRGMLAMPADVRRAQIMKAVPDVSEDEVEDLLKYQEQMRENDPFAAIDDNAVIDGKKGGLFQSIKMAPNFEMSLYIARATGSYIITDSSHRWKELKAAQSRTQGFSIPAAPRLCRKIEETPHRFPWETNAVASMRMSPAFQAHRSLMQDIYRYATGASTQGRRENSENGLAVRYGNTNRKTQKAIAKSGNRYSTGRISILMPVGGINHINANRMLLTSAVEQHLPSVPMVLFIETTNPDVYKQNLV